jgi:hypothetical protein
MAAFTTWLAGDIDAALADAHAAIDHARRIGHGRAEMIAHHAAYFCLHDRAELEPAEEHARASLLIAQQLQAPRFEAEGLAFCAELDRLAGRWAAAASKIESAILISRKTGMAFLGPTILGTAALIADNEMKRREALAEADALLAAGTVFHNHLLFGRDAIEACLEMGDWDRAERYALELAACTRASPFHCRTSSSRAVRRSRQSDAAAHARTVRHWSA